MCISIQFIVSTINVQTLKRIYHYVSHSIKQINQTRNKKQVRNSLSKMKESYQIVLKKALFAPIKGILYLTKGHLENLEVWLEVEFPPNQKIFLTFDSNNEKLFFLFFFFFFQKGNFCWSVHFGCFIFLNYAMKVY